MSEANDLDPGLPDSVKWERHIDFTQVGHHLTARVGWLSLTVASRDEGDWFDWWIRVGGFGGNVVEQGIGRHERAAKLLALRAAARMCAEVVQMAAASEGLDMLVQALGCER